MDILQALLNGNADRAIAVNPRILEAQLAAEFSSNDATYITTLAKGFDNTLLANPFISGMLSTELYSAIAALYGSSQRVLNEVITDNAFDAKSRERATETQARVAQIVRLTSAPLPQQAEETPQTDDIESAITAAVGEGMPEPETV